MEKLVETPAFGILICIIAFKLGQILYNKKQLSILHPVITSTIAIIVFLEITGIKLETFKLGGDFILFFLAPATVILAVPLYRQFHLLKQNILPILVGIFTGALTSVVSVVLLGKLFGLDDLIILSLSPKSVTMPIGMAISEQYNGLVPVTIVSIVIAGVTGAVIAPYICKIFRIKNDVAKGIAIGTASHALGTTKAIEMGEAVGAMSGLAIGVAGVMTVFIIAIGKFFF